MVYNLVGTKIHILYKQLHKKYDQFLKLILKRKYEYLFIRIKKESNGNKLQPSIR